MFEKKIINVLFFLLILLIVIGCVSERNPRLTNEVVNSEVNDVEVKTGENNELCSNANYSTTIVDYSGKELAKGLSKTKLVGLDDASQKKFEKEFEVKLFQGLDFFGEISDLKCLELLILRGKQSFGSFSVSNLKGKLTNLIVLDLEGSDVVDASVVYGLPKLEAVNLKDTNVSEGDCGGFQFDLPKINFICPEIKVKGGLIVEVWDLNGSGQGVGGANVEVSVNGKTYSAIVDVNPEDGLGGKFGVAELFLDYPAPKSFIIKVSKDGYKTQEVTWGGMSKETVYLIHDN